MEHSANVLQTVSHSANERAVYYISPDGSDSNPGTYKRPWRSLKAAKAGAAYYLLPGTHTHGRARVSDSVTALAAIRGLKTNPGKPTLIAAYPHSKRPVLDARGSATDNRYGLYLADNNALIIRGLEGKGAFEQEPGFIKLGEGNRNIEIHGSDFHGTDGPTGANVAGIHIVAGNESIHIHHNYLHDNYQRVTPKKPKQLQHRHLPGPGIQSSPQCSLSARRTFSVLTTS